MENNNSMNELEQMREQMQMLQNKLEKQEIVNDMLVKNSVKSKMSWIKKFVYIEFLMLPFIALVWYVIKELFNLSWYNYAFMMVMATIDAIWDYRINVASLNIEKVENCNLTDTMQKLISMKQSRAKSFFIMISLCTLWFVWTGVEMGMHVIIAPGEEAIKAAEYGGCFGGVIGLIFGLYTSIRIYRKMQRTNDELISQIKEITENV